MQGLNKVMLIGHLGKDPETIEIEKGKLLAKFSLATSESYRDDAGQIHTQTEWHQILTWGKLAEYAQKYLAKGHLVYVEGKIKTRSFEDKAGTKRYVTEIVAERLTHLEKKQKQADETIPSREDVNNDFNLPF